MDVAVVESRQHGGAVRVHHRRLHAAQPFDVTIRPDEQNLVAANRERLRELAVSAGIDAAVGDDQVDRTIQILALRADDEAGDERAADNEDDDQRGQAGRHETSGAGVE